VAYWPGDGQHGPAIIYHGSGGLVSLDARTGRLNTAFGRGGILAPESGGTSGSSPPAIYRDIIISGTANPNRDGRPEDVRGFDVVTGRQLWRFATIPEEGQPGRETWSPGSVEGRRYSSGTSVGVWGLMSVDAQRGIVYVPLDSPQWERWGGDRVGDNLYGDSLVAVDATNGKYLWHFQVTRHDLWDLDLAGAPVLFDVRRNGASIPAVGVMGKSGILFILDRVTGKPIYEVVDRPVEQSTVPGEKSSPTQPFPAKLLPIARLSVAENEIATVTPELHEACTKLVKDNDLKLGGPYHPPGFNRPTVNFPGANGASNWGGMSYNPELGFLIMNTQDLGQITSLGPKGDPIRTNGTSGVRAGDSPTVPYDMTGFNGRFAIIAPGQPMLMCQEPPWGSLTAVNVNTWEIAWKVPLGITESLPPGKQNTGRPNLGSTATTASGLIFVGATDDSRFRAFDARTGKVLWEVTLPAPGRGGPTIFQGRDGKQYVAIVATDLVAYALP
jgi:quinoprotein glucose dehydrogenase